MNQKKRLKEKQKRKARKVKKASVTPQTSSLLLSIITTIQLAHPFVDEEIIDHETIDIDNFITATPFTTHVLHAHAQARRERNRQRHSIALMFVFNWKNIMIQNTYFQKNMK